MDRLKIERIGGLAGFGLPGSHLKSEGEIAMADLSPADRKAVDALFAKKSRNKPMPDSFRYRITRETAQGVRTIEVSEDQVPLGLRNTVKDRLQ